LSDDQRGVLQALMRGNEIYRQGWYHPNEVFVSQRYSTAKYGQVPQAVVVTCSDSRVPTEHIFSAGIGDLFVIRTAGNVISDIELGSIEYGVQCLGAKAVVVMGHSCCGAVRTALDSPNYLSGCMKTVIQQIQTAIGVTNDAEKAEDLNIKYAVAQVFASSLIREYVKAGKVFVIGAKYDIKQGCVRLIE